MIEAREVRLPWTDLNHEESSTVYRPSVYTMSTGSKSEGNQLLAIKWIDEPEGYRWTRIPAVNLLEYAVPSPKVLPRGVNIIYDRSSHVHGYQFSPAADDIYLKAKRVFRSCVYFPYEFSLFVTYKQYVVPKREECIFSLFEDATRDTLISVGFSRDRLVFRFKGFRYRFKMTYGLQDRKWHTLGISMSASTLAVTRDCKRRRVRPLRAPFPDLLPVANTSFSIGRCEKKSSVFQGLLKSVILVSGGDAATRACPTKMDIKPRLTNYIRVYPGYSSLTPFYSRSRSTCEWSDVGNIAFDVHAKKLKVCINGVWREVKISSDKRRMDYLVPYQTLDSGLGAVDVEVFDLPGEGTFAAFAAAGVEPDATYRSNLYQWRNGKFYFYQRLRTSTAQSWEFFRIRNQFFLAVANYGLRKATNSTLYKWNKVRRKFRYYQDIPSSVARDVEAFQIEGEHYLAVANHREGNNNIINSTVFKWSRKDKRFQEFQTLPTMGAYDMTYFTVDIGTGNGLNHGLAVANSFDGKSTLIFSDIYRWQDGRWTLFHSLEVGSIFLPF
ncbi:hypothetical protein RRG08_011764 [Elysia crispata]|uniref:Thrombospondin-like N-terminal domain-containing protein n=1 Tax=Elysia crispata TaxID=231223 RepID=A0AAE0ZQP9_9GAST|nr:hypothetical protein RRG08_011764 [Elysia crispata]